MAIGVKIGGAAAVTADGALFVEADHRIYDTRTWKPMVGAALEVPLSFAVDRQGTVFVVSGARFGVITAGAFSPFTTLPSAGFSVSVATNGNIVLYGDSSEGGGLVFLLRRTAEGKSVIRQLLTTAEPITALESMGDDVIFACGNRIYRAGLVDAERTAIVLLAALPRDAAIRSLAVDSERGVIYLATDEATFVFAGAVVLPILDLGGRLLLSGTRHDQLIVYQARASRAFDVSLPQLSRALSAPQKKSAVKE